MSSFLAKQFIKDYQSIHKAKVRTEYGKLAGFVGIVSNFFLSALKVAIGIIIGSISILADGLNNLADAASSVITLVGFRLSSMPADKDHPFGHQRLEYITGLIVSFIILGVGFILLYNSIMKIINPIVFEMNWVFLGLLIVAIFIKLWQGFFYRKYGKLIKSKALIATARDSFNDVIVTCGVLISALIIKIFGINLDGYMGVIISAFIILSGFQLVKETISPLIGEAPSKEFVKKVSTKILSYPGVLGIHDLIIHNYGPAKTFVTVHVEVDNTVDVSVSHDIIDNIEHDFLKQLEVTLVIHMDPIDVKNPYVLELKEQINTIVFGLDKRLTFHDFRIVRGPSHTNVIFDLVVPLEFEMTNGEIKEYLASKLSEIDKGLHLVITFDKEAIS
ncbi:MAG: cation diffusion facilitator family transporter [Bacilli bacterium]|jgi:cation diffusion facilitator family transporter|nr:cation diffusion facilitator family transporter [Bacilli bacterium]